jgi:hypothetical protein
VILESCQSACSVEKEKHSSESARKILKRGYSSKVTSPQKVTKGKYILKSSDAKKVGRGKREEEVINR